MKMIYTLLLSAGCLLGASNTLRSTIDWSSGGEQDIQDNDYYDSYDWSEEIDMYEDEPQEEVQEINPHTFLTQCLQERGSVYSVYSRMATQEGDDNLSRFFDSLFERDCDVLTGGIPVPAMDIRQYQDNTQVLLCIEEMIELSRDQARRAQENGDEVLYQRFLSRIDVLEQYLPADEMADQPEPTPVCPGAPQQQGQFTHVYESLQPKRLNF